MIPNEEEIITTIAVTFEDQSGIDTPVTFRFFDGDGAGGNPPSVFDTIRLQQSSIYNAHILLLNETLTPPDTISNEVRNEGVDHLFCFSYAGISLDIQRTDSDGTFEIGLESTWTTTTSGSGNVTITLRHQPGIKNGNCDLGDTDVEVSFPIVIE